MSTDYNHGFCSVYRLTAHVVFVIKYRRKVINNEILARLKEIFVSTLTKWESVLLVSTVNQITFT
jgi:putative transposase|nr:MULTISPECIES: transposase [unclassified Microcystis]